MKKNLLSVLLIAAMLLSACFALAEEEALRTIELGTSGLVMSVPESYCDGGISSEDTDESQVAYFFSENSLVDFDVYQWAKAEGETLKAVAADEAVLYEAETVETEINGIDVVYYTAIEESEGAEYKTVTYLMENGDFFAEVVFWMDGENANDEIEAMINTLAVAESGEISESGTHITLGASSLSITLPVAYQLGEISAEDTDESQVAYYYSKDSLIDFDVYQWAKAEGETLTDVAAAEAADYGAEAAEMTVGDITLAYYTAIETSEETEYTTVTYITEDGGDFVEIVFWLDGENAEATVDSIINTIAR